jgi:hypothetical protein
MEPGESHAKAKRTAAASRTILGFLLATGIAACGSAADGGQDAAPAATAGEIDERAGSYRNVGFGATKTEATRQLGRSRSGDPLAPLGSGALGDALPLSPRYPAQRSARYIWRFRHVAIAADHKGAWLIGVAHPHATTAAGVSVGDPLERARAAYPSLRCGTANEGTEYVSFPYCTGRLAGRRYIWLGDDPIQSITISVAPLK